MRMRNALGWVAVAGAIELVARTLAYAFSPDPRAEAFDQATGGPRPVAIAAVALVLAALLSGAVLWLSSLSVRERHRLRPGAGVLPRLRLRRMALRAASLLVVNSIVFTSIEVTIHEDEGLGFHGMHCLFGPVHRDALPLIAALALIAAALVEAVGHAIAFGRRVVAAEASARRIARALRPALVLVAVPATYVFDPVVARGDRGPPALTFC
jgi:hypothetical protein